MTVRVLYEFEIRRKSISKLRNLKMKTVKNFIKGVRNREIQDLR